MTVPAGWTGEVHGDGTGSVTVTGATFTVSCAGSGDFWGTGDSGSFVYKNLAAENIIKVVSVDPCINPNSAYIRFYGLRSSAATNAKMFALIEDDNHSHVSTVWRDTVGGTADYQGNDAGPVVPAAPYWAKLTYDGTTARAYVSSNGTDYTLVNSRAISGLTVVAAMHGGDTPSSAGNTYQDLTNTSDPSHGGFIWLTRKMGQRGLNVSGIIGYHNR